MSRSHLDPEESQLSAAAVAVQYPLPSSGTTTSVPIANSCSSSGNSSCSGSTITVAMRMGMQHSPLPLDSNHHRNKSLSAASTTATPTSSSSSERGRSPVQIPFLFVVKLHELLKDCEGDPDGKGRIISWTPPHGTSFKVHKPKEIIQSILPTYFNQTKYKSFQRQLNLWGFDRNTSIGPEKGAYYHPCFQRDQTLVVERLRRVRAIPKIPAKERRRRQALLKQQHLPQQVQLPLKPHDQQPQPQPQQHQPPLQQQSHQPLDTATDVYQSSLENPDTETTLIPLDDGMSTLLGVAETLSALRRQPPPAVNALTSAILPIPPSGNKNFTNSKSHHSNNIR